MNWVKRRLPSAETLLARGFVDADLSFAGLI
jgi:hypothetical protein